MRENANIKIYGSNVILVPYEAKHVEKYHQWMADPELQQLTASEPLSLDQEYEMQETWRHDEDKCTFLVLDRATYERTQNEIESLIGDTNLFLNQDYFIAESDDEGCQDHIDNEIIVAEAEIMIAEASARGKGYGKEALLIMLKYGQSALGVQEFVAKIGYDNVVSQNLFKQLQFEEVTRSDVFKEITYKRTVDDNWTKWLTSGTNFYKIDEYRN